MKKVLALLAVLASAAVFAVTPAGAVQYGSPDGTGHPYVGLVVFYDSAGAALWRCTGSLISPTVFLTAAHCTEAPAASANIWFSPGPISVSSGYPYTGNDASGTPYPHPGWTGGLTIPNTHDVGVVSLGTPYFTSSYGMVAPLGYLDSLATQRGLQDVTFTVVGYGLQSVKPSQSALRIRMAGTVHLVNLTSALTDGYNLHYSNEPGVGNGGSGGTCFGDSGGPVLHMTGSGSEVIVAVNSFVLNSNCKGAGFGYRVDIADAQSFIFSF